MTCSPDYITHGFDELKKADHTVSARSALDRGVFSAHTELPFPEFSKLVNTADPIFVRHIHPIDEVISIDRSKNDLLLYIDLLLKNVQSFSSGQKVAIQVRRVGGTEFGYTTYGVKEALDPFLLENGLVPVVQDADFIISLFLTANQALWGISTPVHNLSDWPGGAIRFQKVENQTSRSRFKLEEACLVFGIDLSSYRDALDLGSSPGGWTSYLLDQGLEVTSVDTGKLEESLLNHPNLHYYNKNASDVGFPEDTFDVITCDMSWDPFHTTKIVREHGQSLRSGGILIFTIKLMHKKIVKTIEECLHLLEEEDFERLHVKQLFHNRDEVTAYLRKR